MVSGRIKFLFILNFEGKVTSINTSVMHMMIQGSRVNHVINANPGKRLRTEMTIFLDWIEAKLEFF